MTLQAGRKRAAFYNSATYGSPTWVQFARITEVTRPQSRSTSDRMYRGAKNKKKATGYIERSFAFKYIPKKAGTTDTVLDKLEDSFVNETVLDVCFMTGTFDTGTTRVGVRGPFVVSKFDLNEPDEEGVSYDVELVEVEDDTIPESVAYSVTTA